MNTISSPLVSVIFPFLQGGPYSYKVSEELFPSLQRGQIVEAPFRSGMKVGVIWELNPEITFSGKTKEVARCLPLPPLPSVSLDFIGWVSRYTLTALPLVLKMVLSADMQERKSRIRAIAPSPDIHVETRILSPDQEAASQAIGHAIDEGVFQAFMLDGVTGSGKTEVYLEAMVKAFAQKKQVLVLLPEIALTNQWLSRFHRRFGCLPLQWHSAMTPAMKREIWKMVLSGEGCVVVGARSALFLPFPNLGLIVVDEEHDASYKQEEQTLYHARDMAVVRAHLSRIPIVLTSATPSLETYVNMQIGRYKTLKLTTRHGAARLPEIHLIDMRTQPKGQWISPLLQKAMTETFQRQEQAMLFLNRRGYAPLTLCRSCGHRLKCPACSAWLVEHRHKKQLHCHYCSFHREIPLICPDCQQPDTWIPCGPGVERIHERAQLLFPQARMLVLSSDTFGTPDQIDSALHLIAQREVDLVIGTQILAKGHHFPFITTVGVIDADLGLSGGDLRGCERTYQVLHQVSGRAGREHLPGRVFLQTYNPENPIMQALQSQDRDRFLMTEAAEREAHGMPPYGRLASLIISDVDLSLVEKTAKQLFLHQPHGPDIMILGPSPAVLSQLRGRHRWRFLMKAPKNAPIQQWMSEWVSKIDAKKSARIVIDIDPYNFM